MIRDALKKSDEVTSNDGFADGGRIGFDNGGSPRTITNQYGTFEVKGDDKRFTKSTVAKPKNGITFSEFRTKAATQPNFLKEVINLTLQKIYLIFLKLLQKKEIQKLVNTLQEN